MNVSNRGNPENATEAGPENAGERGPTLREQTSRIARDVKDLGSIAADEFFGKVQSAKAKGREAIRKGGARIRKTESDFERLIGAHPFKSLALAIGVGALLGFALRRKRATVASDGIE